MTTTNKTTTAFLAYCGRRWDNTGKLTHYYQRAEHLSSFVSGPMIGLSGRVGHHKGSKQGTDVIGAIYAVDEGADEQFFGGAFITDRKVADELASQWHALDVAAVGIHRNKVANKKAAKNAAYLEALLPIRGAMQKTNAAGRRAILADVLEYLTR